MSKHAKTIDEKAHLGRVAELGCCVSGCGSPAHAHHIRDGKQGMGQKASDYETIPLCPYHHMATSPEGFHALGRALWEDRYGSQRDHLNYILFELYGEKRAP